MGTLPRLPYHPAKREQLISAFLGLNRRDGAQAGELQDAVNLSTESYPSLVPRRGRVQYGEYTAPTAIFSWDKLVVVDGTTIYYDGKALGTVTPGEKQFAVVNTKLVIWPDKIYIDLTEGVLKRMEEEVTAEAAMMKPIVFSTSTLEMSVSGLIQNRTENVEYVSEPELKAYTGLTWDATAKTWTKTGESEKGISQLAADDLVIPAENPETGDYMLPTGDREENTRGIYYKLTAAPTVTQKKVKRWIRWTTESVRRSYVQYEDHTDWDMKVNISLDDNWWKDGYWDYSFDSTTGNYIVPPSGKPTFAFGPGGENGRETGTWYVSGTGKTLYKYYIEGSEGNYSAWYATRTAKTVTKYYTDYIKGETQVGEVIAVEGTYPSGGYKYDQAAGVYYWYEEDKAYVGETRYTAAVKYGMYRGGGKLEDYFQVGDFLDITVLNTNGEETENTVKKVRLLGAEGDVLTFESGTFSGERKTSGTVTVAKKLPEIDFICSHNNRLYGASNESEGVIWDAETESYKTVRGRVIYVSALGDPESFFQYNGVDTDSYAVAVASRGEFTGCIEYGDGVAFFKEEMLYRLVGDYPSNFYLYDYYYTGVQKGCHRSLLNVNEVLYWRGRNGFYAYAGAAPELISYKLGDEDYEDVSGGSDREKIWWSGRAEDGWHILTYDLQHGLWTREDETHAAGYTWLDGVMYMIAEDAVYTMDGARDVGWMAELAPMREDGSFSKRDYRWLRLRYELELGAEIAVDMKTDGSEWEEVYLSTDPSVKTVNIPIKNGRCDVMQIRLRGKGNVKVRSISRAYFAGSEEK